MCAFSGELTIDLSVIQRNYKFLDGLTSETCETAASVKADAYGLGAAQVVPALYKSGVRRFFLATLDEGILVRQLLPDAFNYILNGFMHGAGDVYVEHKLVPVLNALDQIHHYKALALRVGERLPAVLHFDTGMNRLGIVHAEAQILCRDLSVLEGLDVQYVMSHFSSSEEIKNPINIEQYQKFESLFSYFKATPKSLCNSGGMFQSPLYHLDLTRPGIALYGGNPVSGSVNPMGRVVSLAAPIVQVHSVQRGERCGYNGTYCFDKKSHIAIVSIGYADGILRCLGNVGALYWNGARIPIRGRVSMDLVICDLSEIPEKDFPVQGDHVEVIGAHQSLDDIARDAGTISYEVLTSLGGRYRRLYIQ